ncbi:MAG: CopG family transcriptional regulator [Methylococcaceae bacterium]
MKATEFDQLFDDNEDDIMEHLDLKNVCRPNLEQRNLSLEIPLWMLESLDKEAVRVGETRQSLVKLWLSDKLVVHA